jgi:predicted ATPase
MALMESLREQLPEGPARAVFERIERLMGEFDVDGMQAGLCELTAVLEIPEEEC